MQEISAITNEIVSICDPLKIYLFAQKKTLLGDIKSMDFCIVCRSPDKKALSTKIFLDIDSEIPFSIVIYSDDEWDAFHTDEHSFASRILEKGKLIYAKTS